MLNGQVLVLAVLAGVACVLYLVRDLVSSGPHKLPRRLPRKIRGRARVGWRERPFFGWGRDWLGWSCFALGTPEDSVAIVGPPRVGKTAGVLVPQALMWGGPLVSTSTKPDVLRATAGRRLQLAAPLGGSVYVYAPTALGTVEGLQPIRWSPLAGCQDPRVAALRVDTLVNVAQVGRGVENADHWRAGAGRILRPYFLAAAHHSLRPGDFAVVRDWLSRHEFTEPQAILGRLGTLAGFQWAAELKGVQDTPERERGSFFSAAQNTLGATADPTVLRSCGATDLDPVEFLTTRSTLYVVSPSEHQRAVAPLIAALVESIVNAAYDLHREGRLPARLLLSLDELANIAPLPSLESIVSQGAGQGVLTSWAVQSQAQLRHHYGEHAADAIWSATRSKVVFGGLADGHSLDQLSRLIGDHQVETRSASIGADGQRQETRGKEWRPRLSPAELRQLPPRWAVLLYHDRKPFVLRVPIAVRKRRLRRALLPWPVPAASMPAPRLLIPQASPSLSPAAVAGPRLDAHGPAAAPSRNGHDGQEVAEA